MVTIDGINYEFRRFHRCVQLATALINKPTSRFLHFSFIMRGTKILSIGWNDRYREGTMIAGKLFTYPLSGVHSEAAAIGDLTDLNLCRKATLVNVRLNRHRQLRCSKPCNICLGLLNRVGFKRVYFSTEESFELLYL